MSEGFVKHLMPSHVHSHGIATPRRILYMLDSLWDYTMDVRYTCERWIANNFKLSLVFRSSRAAAHVRCYILFVLRSTRTHEAREAMSERKLYFRIYSLYGGLGPRRCMRGTYSQKEDVERLLKTNSRVRALPEYDLAFGRSRRRGRGLEQRTGSPH